jgi:hypothetical protein
MTLGHFLFVACAILTATLCAAPLADAMDTSDHRSDDVRERAARR